MIFSSLSAWFKYLLGILLVQGVAGILVYVVLKTDQQEVWLLMGAVALLTGLLTALWFTSIAGHHKKDALEHERADNSKKRERLKVDAEREKTKVIKQSHQQITKERNSAQRSASLKVGAAFAAMVGLGAFLMLTQLISLGVLTLTTAGGALGGYLFRGRQERIGRGEGGPSLLTSTTKKLAAPLRKALERKTEDSSSATRQIE